MRTINQIIMDIKLTLKEGDEALLTITPNGKKTIRYKITSSNVKGSYGLDIAPSATTNRPTATPTIIKGEPIKKNPIVAKSRLKELHETDKVRTFNR